MQISVIGFPRIGTLRELKFASEKYFKKEIEAGELLQKAPTTPGFVSGSACWAMLCCTTSDWRLETGQVEASCQSS